MTITLTFNLPSPLSEATSPSLNPKLTNFALIKPRLCSTFSSLSLLSQRSLSLSKTQMKNTVICARNNKRRTGYVKVNRFVLESVYLLVTNFDVLGEPLASMVKAFGGGNGGGVRFFKGFGGGGKKKNNKNLLFLVFMIAFGFVMWFGLGEKLEGDLFLVILVLIVFGALISKCWKSGFSDWLQGVCFIAAMEFLGLRRENLQRVMKGFQAMIDSKRRNRGRAMLWEMIKK